MGGPLLSLGILESGLWANLRSCHGSHAVNEFRDLINIDSSCTPFILEAIIQRPSRPLDILPVPAMPQKRDSFNNSGIRGNIEQYSVNGSYTRNTGRTYHHHNAPTYNYTTNANGAPVVNGAFNGVQYNISSPSQSE